MPADDDDIIDSAVVRIGPDLRGFRTKLKKDLAEALKGIEGSVKIKLVADKTGFAASVRGQLKQVGRHQFKVRLVADRTGFARSVREQLKPANLPEFKVKVVADTSGLARSVGDAKDATEREGLNYVAGLRTKYIKDQLKHVRNANEQITRAHGQADQHELQQERSFQETLDRLHLRAADNELNRTRSSSEKRAQAHDQANQHELKRTRSHLENLAQVQARAQEIDAYSPVRSVTEKVARDQGQALRQFAKESQRKGETAQNFAEHVNSELRKIEQARADDEITIRHQTAAQVTAIDREASRLRIATLTALERAEKESLRRSSAEQVRAASAAKARNKTLFTGPKIIDYGGKGIKPTNLLLGAVVAMTPALFAMASSALQASTSIAALGSASIGAAFAVGGLAVAFQGIGDALTLRKSVQDEALTAAANAKDATDDLARARRNLADAQRDEKTANADVHEQRREAIRDLADLKRAVIDLNNQYKADSLSVDEAREAEGATHRNFFATALEKRRATQDRLDAQTKLGDTALERKQRTEDLKTSLKKGIEGSDKVRDAKERARDARDRTLDAQDSVRTQQKNAGGISKTSSAAAQLKKKLADMAPAARDIYYWFDKNEQTFKRLQRNIAQAILPGFYKFLEAVNTKASGKTTLELAAQYAGELGAIISKYAGVFGEWTKSDFFRERMGRIQETNAEAFDALGRALTILAKPLLRIIDRAAPGFKIMANSFERFAIRIDKFIAKADEDGSLSKWFEDARVSARKWFDLAGNIVGIVKNLFRASLPSGGSLLDQFRAFTQSIEDWTGNNQVRITAFFDRIASLPFARILDFFTNAILFFGVFRAFMFLKALNPFAALLTAMVAADPSRAADAFEKVGRAVSGIIGWLSSHPEAAATLLGILAAAKFAKAVGFDIKIPVVNSLRDALVSRFKVLDKFVGGGAQTATMTVQAGVVNVYGGAGVGGTAASAAGGNATKAGGLAGIVANLGVAAAVAVIAFAVTKYMDRRAYLNTATGKEKYTFDNIKNDVARFGPLGQPVNDPKVVNRKAITEYIAARKKSVAAAVEEAKATGDLKLAKQLEIAETVKSVNTLSTLLQEYGYTEKRANSYARAVYDLNGLLYQQGIELDNASAKATAAEKKFGILGETISEVTGNKVITLTLNGYGKVLGDVETVMAYQQLIKRGESPTQSAVNKQKRTFLKNTYADGGEVAGHSPHPRADNIPAWLTANEYVQPVDAVQYYGTDFMDAVRTRSLPKYAAGGLVGGSTSWPFQVKIPDPLTAVQQYTDAYVPVSGGTASGNVNVAEVAESTARAMGASTKQLIALIEAGLVESGLRNLNYGDRDSVGFLQQRAGWGSLKARMDVATATRKFISKARRVDNAKLTAGQLAQAVQVSAFPDRYAAREADAVAVLNRFAPTLAGYGPSNTSGGKLPGTWQGLWATIQSQFPKATLNSAFRKNSRTLNGGLSRHSLGKAIDVSAWKSIAEYIYRSHGTSTYELISPWSNLDLYKGKPHKYDRRTQIQHGAHGDPTNNAHVHWSTYDKGGTLPPGYTLAFNGTGKNETIRTAEQEKNLNAPMRIDRRDLAQLAALFGGGTSAVNMDGRKVAELTNKYNYLPAGV